MNRLSLPILAALGTTVFLWASAFVGIRAGLRGYNPGVLALFRYLVASASIAILYWRLPNKHKVTWKELPKILMLGIIGFGLYNIALNFGEISVTAGIASFIVGLMPIFTMILAVIFLNEQVNLQAWIGVGVSFIGVALIAAGEHEGIKFDYGVIYVLIAAICGSVYTVMQKPLLRKFHPIEITAFGIWSGTFVMLIFLPKLVHELPHASWQATSATIYLGIFPAAIAYATWSYALTHIKASDATVFLYGMPVIATLLGWLLLGEIPTLLALIGGIVALLGAVIVNRRAAFITKQAVKKPKKSPRKKRSAKKIISKN